MNIMVLPCKSRTIAVAVFLGAWFFAWCTVPAMAQDETGVPAKLVVGVMDFPPFAMQRASGEWKGLSVGLLQAVARDLNTAIELREFSRVDQLEAALADGEVHLTPVAAVTAGLEVILDFSNPYSHSGSAIAVKTTSGRSGLLRLAGRFFSITSLKVIASLGLMWIIAGLLVWLFERRQDHKMFGDRFLHGLGHGIWWAAVTMTTVGYGDKAPKTVGGRVVAIVWMLASIVVISSFTATIATSLTVDQLRGKVHGFNDLPNVRVGTLTQSEFLETLAHNGISATPYKNIPAGLQALSDSDIDAFVHDEALLKHLVKTRFPGRLHVLPDIYKHYYICMALPPGSQLREPLNRALLKVMAGEEWRVLLKRYLGSKHM
jgi:polar amino acid transport system substrate-binding protein